MPPEEERVHGDRDAGERGIRAYADRVTDS